MELLLFDIISLLTGKFMMPGWSEAVNGAGEKIAVKDFAQLDGVVRCIGVSCSHVAIYSCKYEKSLDFLDKPQYYIIVVNDESLRRHMEETSVKEVLEAFRRLKFIECK
jgi:hypothetical protein